MNPRNFSGPVLVAFGLGLAVGLVTATAGFAVWHGRATSTDKEGNVARIHEMPAAAEIVHAVRVSARLLPATRGMAPTSPSTRADPSSAEQLLALADEHRRKREFGQACDAYRSVVAMGRMSADAWADFADAQGSLAGRLSGEPARAIERALELEPRHTKALWLKASLAHEERRYTDALLVWKQLAALVPRDSSDARIIDANIAEASRLAAS